MKYKISPAPSLLKREAEKYIQQSLKFFCFLILSVLFSCTSEKPAGTQQVTGPDGTPESGTAVVQPGAGDALYGLEIRPQNPSRNSTLTLAPKGFGLHEADIVWIVNGFPVSTQVSHIFKSNEMKRGDIVEAKVTFKGREISSSKIEIRNSPPEVSKIRVLPQVFKPGDSMFLEVSGKDPDGDEVTFTYEWTKNGEPAGKDKMIEVPIKRGDKVFVKVTPFDGVEYGRSYLLNTEIGNLPPVIVEDKIYAFDGRVFTYQVKASDPDGDPLVYSLKTAPPGVSIDPVNGLITWQVPDDYKGKVACAVHVQDGKGGEATYVVNLEVNEEETR